MPTVQSSFPSAHRDWPQAAEQAGTIEELSSGLTEISDSISKNAEDAADVNRGVSGVRQELDIGSRQMRQTTDSMRKINEASGQIGEIIKTIEDIAFQTNILSLNAAVEAARAGEAGKGFSVVADEVRNLAGKSSEAAQNTAQLIQNSLQAVKEGSAMTDATAATFQKIIDTTEQAARQIEQITQNSSHQAESVRQITSGVSRISDMVQATSATAEESAAASRELSGQADRMKKMISVFQLPEA